MGFLASSYLGLGRQYQGRLDGRQVEAQFSPGRMLHNGLLNIRIETNLNQRMAIGMKKPLLDCRDCEKVDIPSNLLGSIQIFSEDKEWGLNFLSDPSYVELVNFLMDNSIGLGMREIYLQNGQVWLHARPLSNFHEIHIQDWLNTLLKFCEAMEKTN